VTGADHDRQHRVDRLTAAAKQRTERAQQHAEKTIRRMLRNQQAITFRAVHRESGLSLDFLYNNDTIRTRIDHARRAQGEPIPSPRQPTDSHSSDGTVIRVLTSQLQAAKRDHRREVDDLRRQLALATGEILVLRERVRVLDHQQRSPLEQRSDAADLNQTAAS
jgi:hypothetical protein